jgi:hypothetical protein
VKYEILKTGCIIEISYAALPHLVFLLRDIEVISSYGDYFYFFPKYSFINCKKINDRSFFIRCEYIKIFSDK